MLYKKKIYFSFKICQTRVVLLSTTETYKKTVIRLSKNILWCVLCISRAWFYFKNYIVCFKVKYTPSHPHPPPPHTHSSKSVTRYVRFRFNNIAVITVSKIGVSHFMACRTISNVALSALFKSRTIHTFQISHYSHFFKCRATWCGAMRFVHDSLRRT